MATTERRTLRGDHNQCAGCSEFFNSSRAFEKHRAGEHEGGQRRCLTPDEMRERGMALNSSGWWVGSLRENASPNSSRDSVGDFLTDADLRTLEEL